MDMDEILKEFEEENKKLKREIGLKKLDMDNILSCMMPEVLLRINNGNLINLKLTTCDVLDKIRIQNKELIEQCEYLKAEITDLKMAGSKIIAEPIKVAENLIYATQNAEYGLLGVKLGEGKQPFYSKSELRQIAEHLLVYCNGAEK